jgi:hypothetical protein
MPEIKSTWTSSSKKYILVEVRGFGPKFFSGIFRVTFYKKLAGGLVSGVREAD